MSRPLLAASLATLALIAGCSNVLPSRESDAAATSATAPLPPRAGELRLDGLNPCSALTSAQRTQLDLAPPLPEPDAPGGPACQWGHPPKGVVASYLVQRSIGYPAERALRAQQGASVTSVAGFPAVQTRLNYVSSDRNCVLFIDVAEGQSLFVHYTYDGFDVPMTEELACEKVQTAAELAMQTLIARAAG